MDRSEGAEWKGRKAALFRVRDGGKPCVAQPPQRDMAIPNDFKSPRPSAVGILLFPNHSPDRQLEKSQGNKINDRFS